MKIDEIRKFAIECLINNRIESDFLEYKKSNLQKDRILKTMCSFANNLMNRKLNLILIGIEEHEEPDLKGTPIHPILGFNEGQIETIENSIKALTHFIKPKINFDIAHASIDNRFFVIVSFSNNEIGPYEVTDKAEKDKTINLKRGRYVRIERDSRLATIKEEFELLRKFSNYHFSDELSNVATIDDLDIDYIREYLNLTSARNNTTILSKEEIIKNMNLIDLSTNLVKNYAILMFSRNPEKFIPYSYIELIYRSPFGESIMSSKEYRGPIWKQIKNIMSDIKNNYLYSLTLRVEDKVESETVYNYPYSTIEELITNAIVHKNYENPRTIQVYIYDDSIVITNYNKPIPPITIKDLNCCDSFPNRMYENPPIREMFKALDYIESYGSGIGKAKRAMEKNGIEMIHFKEYDENIDITSVVIPVNSKFLKYKNLGIKDQNLDIKDQNLDIKDQNLDIKDQNLDIHKVEIKVNSIDIVGLISESSYSKLIKKSLLKIYNNFFNDIFSRKQIIDYLNVTKSTAGNYINYLIRLSLIESIKGNGKGKYRFK